MNADADNESENYLERKVTLTLNNVPLGEGLKFIANQAGLKIKIESYAVTLVSVTENGWPFPEIPSANATDSEATELMKRKLDEIILPLVNFKGTTAKEAFQFFARRSRELDTTETDPNKKGVNIVINADPDYLERKVTVNLNNVPLGEGLRFIANQAGLKVKVESYAVTLTSRAEVQITSKEYILPPNFFKSSGVKNAKDLLVSSGVTFPGESTALYIPSQNKLILHNTPENHAIMDALIKSASFLNSN